MLKLNVIQNYIRDFLIFKNFKALMLLSKKKHSLYLSIKKTLNTKNKIYKLTHFKSL